MNLNALKKLEDLNYEIKSVEKSNHEISTKIESIILEKQQELYRKAQDDFRDYFSSKDGFKVKVEKIGIYAEYKNLSIIFRAQYEYSRTHFDLMISGKTEEKYDIIIGDCDKPLDQSKIKVSFGESTVSNKFDRLKQKLKNVKKLSEKLQNEFKNINNIKNCFFINHKDYKNRNNKFKNFKSLLDCIFS